MGESVGWQVTVQVVIKAFEGRRLRMESVEPCIQSSDGRQSKHCKASYYTPLKKEEGKKRKKNCPEITKTPISDRKAALWHLQKKALVSKVNYGPCCDVACSSATETGWRRGDNSFDLVLHDKCLVREEWGTMRTKEA